MGNSPRKVSPNNPNKSAPVSSPDYNQFFPYSQPQISKQAESPKEPEKKPEAKPKTPEKKPEVKPKTPEKKPEVKPKTPEEKPEVKPKTPEKKPEVKPKTPEKKEEAKPKKPEKKKKVKKPKKPKKVKPTKSQLILNSRGDLKTMPPPPESLKIFEDLDSLFIQDSCEPIELYQGFDTGTQYVVSSMNKQILFTAYEKPNCCKLCICRTDRAFQFKLRNKDGKEILQIIRPCSCKCCCGAKLCGDLCGHKVLVTLEDGSKAGEVVQRCYRGRRGRGCCCTPMYVVYDCVGNPTLRIAGPSCGFMCCCRTSNCCGGNYKVLSLIKDPVAPVEIGQISNKWGESNGKFVHSRFVSPEDAFVVGSTFPPNLDNRTKAAVIGALFLIDFLHYEKEPCCGFCQFCC